MPMERKKIKFENLQTLETFLRDNVSLICSLIERFDPEKHYKMLVPYFHRIKISLIHYESKEAM